MLIVTAAATKTARNATMKLYVGSIVVHSWDRYCPSGWRSWAPRTSENRIAPMPSSRRTTPWAYPTMNIASSTRAMTRSNGWS